MIRINATPETLATKVLNKIKEAKIGHAIPAEKVLIELFRTLFYTSLKTEEGQHIRVTLTLIDPNNPDPSPPQRVVAERWQYVRFEKRIEFTVNNLVKLAKAADVWSSSLAVYYNDSDELFIWGMIDQAVHYHSFLNYESDSGPEQPGIFQSTITGIGSLTVIFDYDLIAALKQNVIIVNYIDVFKRGEVKDIFEAVSKHHKNVTKKYLNEKEVKNNIDYWETFPESLIKESLSRILLRIQNYQHGGAILISGAINSDLDVKYAISYSRLSKAIENVIKVSIDNSRYFDEIRDLLEADNEQLPSMVYLDESISNYEREESRNELKGVIRYIASLSCVDGLVLMDNSLNINGFGVVIKTSKTPKEIYTSKTAKINASKLTAVDPNSYGTRHRSMFSYCWKYPGSIGFVVSQDGEIRAITRIGDKLIMWENIRVQRYLVSKKLKRSSISSKSLGK